LGPIDKQNIPGGSQFGNMFHLATRTLSRAAFNSPQCSLLVKEILGSSTTSAHWGARCRAATAPLIITPYYMQSWKPYHRVAHASAVEGAEDKLLLLNAVGDDKEGKMSSITARVLAHGGSLEDSKMSRMDGEFGLLLKIRIPEPNSTSLVAELGEQEGLQVRSRWVAGTGIREPVTTIELRSVDRPGLVNDINQYFLSSGCVIQTLSAISGAAEQGKEMFDVHIAMRLPERWNSHSHIAFSKDLQTMGIKVNQFYTSVMVGNGIMRLDHADLVASTAK